MRTYVRTHGKGRKDAADAHRMMMMRSGCEITLLRRKRRGRKEEEEEGDIGLRMPISTMGKQQVCLAKKEEKVKEKLLCLPPPPPPPPPLVMEKRDDEVKKKSFQKGSRHCTGNPAYSDECKKACLSLLTCGVPDAEAHRPAGHGRRRRRLLHCRRPVRLQEREGF